MGRPEIHENVVFLDDIDSSKEDDHKWPKKP